MKYRARNKITREVREGKVSLATLEKVSDSGIDKCCGPCKCSVEPDGECPKGWPSRMIAAGII